MVLCLEPNGQGNAGEFMISSTKTSPSALGLCNTFTFKTEWLKSPQTGTNDHSCFSQCSSHVLDLKASQKALCKKGNSRHAGPHCLGAVCDCVAKVFAAYSFAKFHRASE